MNAQELRQITEARRVSLRPEVPCPEGLVDALTPALADLILAEAHRAAQQGKDAIHVVLADFPYSQMGLVDQPVLTPTSITAYLCRYLRRKGLTTSLYLPAAVRGKAPCGYLLRVSW